MPGSQRGVIAWVIDAARNLAVVARVFFFVGLGLAIFMAAYLGYFVLPFVFVLAAFAILGVTGITRYAARIRRALTRR
jgi:uncharacterized membrane protein